jgi:hypothetical protein
LQAWGKQKVGSDLVPSERAEEFAGLIADIPVLDSPWIPEERIYIVNLPSVATYIEGPSQVDSGLTIELRVFNAEEARTFLEEHPEVKEEGATDDATVLLLQDRVLCDLVMEWRLEPGEHPAARCVAGPTDLRHKAPGRKRSSPT